ncbi:MAG: redox-regulated ATPase YchF [Nanoarchaeota archaeon]|nr:redox-regulated ATPase YchF [Nanoarchaeota archaeon]
MLIALCGKPSSGKSTFFKASTLAEVEIDSRPFTTLKSSEGIAFVSIDCVDKDFNKKCDPKEGFCIENKRFVPVKLMDVPGLIKNSHLGKGLGNQFLDDLRQADAFIHIIDVSGSTDEHGNVVEPLHYDPSKDIEFLDHELDMWYYQILSKGWKKFARQVKQENLNIKKALAKQLSGLKINEEDVEERIKKLKLVHNPEDWSEDDLKDLARELRKLKPMLIAANKLDVEGSLYNLDRIKEKFPDYVIIGCSAEIELALREAAKKKLIEYVPGDSDFKVIGKLNEEQKKGLDFVKKYLKKFNNSGVQEIINKLVFEMLNYIAVYPVANAHLTDKDNNILPDCYLVPDGSTALELAFKIHQDIGKNFIKAMDVKTKRVVGKDYKLKNKDVVEIIVKN